jgi:transcriptional regulator with XRE-family HTH domain
MTLRFDTHALFEALEAQRSARGLTWADIARETGVAVTTLKNTQKGGRLEVDGMLAMVRWLGRTVESFTRETRT